MWTVTYAAVSGGGVELVVLTQLDAAAKKP